MNNKLLWIFLALFSILNVYGQRDTEHWIAPMRDRVSGSGEQKLYISTDSTTPFQVSIYNNNTVIGTVTVSKGSPQTYDINNRSLIISNSNTDLFTQVPMGLYLKADRPFYVTLRFAVSSHAEIITSKGKAGIGKKFYSVHAPLTTNSTIYNFMTGILATEDNTTVTVSNYDPTVQFTNGTSGATNPTMTFTLNKGKSYIIEGIVSVNPNRDGFIGAKIVADKPISVTNGNFNGQFAITNSFVGSDIVMDQSVPVERLGNEFVMVKGNGDIGQGMEGAVVVATEDNTQIFVNTGAAPVATLNEGDYYRINDNVWNNMGNGHYNMYIKSNKNVYVYQLLAGVSNSNATLGFNYIPPLNCFLPKKIDEIGKIGEMPMITPSVKLNILTEAGATVTVNGIAPSPTSGPYTVPGTTNWVSYSIQNVTGNMTITSTRAVTAGIIGGASVYGYGGYFAGFSSIPVIYKKTGTCAPGIILEVDDGFDSYQWALNGTPIIGATGNSYSPTAAGQYTCVVTVVGCQPVTTPTFDVLSCPQNTTTSLDVCGYTNITPKFSVSTQPIDYSSVTIVTPPSQGTANINVSNGVITYTPNPGYIGPDSFVYTFNSTVPKFADSEIVTVNINVAEIAPIEDTLTACPYNGLAVYDLTTANVTTSAPPYNKEYYQTLIDAQNGVNMIPNPTSYQSAPGFAYVKIISPTGCTAYAKVNLEHSPIPTVNEASMVECYNEGTPKLATFNLNNASVTTTAPVTKKFYPSLKDAENGTNEILDPTAFISPTTTVYVKVFNSSNCYAITKITLTVNEPYYSLVLKDQVICIEDTTTLDAGPGFGGYQWSTGDTSQSISNVTVGEYFVDLTHNGCITRQKVRVIKSPEPVINAIEITHDTATLTIIGGVPPYKYSIDGVNWQDSNVFTGLPRGENTFFIKDKMDCNPVTLTLTIPKIVNAITPNNDNINDYLDYSQLAYKGDLDFSIYDRYGSQIFKGDKKNNYRWDAKLNNKKLPTGTYWFSISWTEKDKTIVKYSGWVIVKNRE